MIAVTFALVGPAQDAGIIVPDDVDEYNKEEFLRWHILCVMQLGQPMPTPYAHWENAKAVASVPEERLKTVTPKELREEFGFQVGYSG